ncbi:tetratricopeptide repeat protein [Pelosinus sp. IPA-1]|uniref:tetratricopeptide repeat protein n=1 Tax=Pelosinus sp. IPA-1 TaxID=3029569 RepID=UPI0024362BEE|nr:tetratricopeptide repeat protein [Pelosinus sp. IPA-1]GMB01217.1 hypothetical protein PIPA1_40160 [Pelosinus sp. IPA-1]
MTVEECIVEGLTLIANHEWRQAALFFCQAIKLDPSLPEAYQRLGEVLILIGDWDNAQACFGKVIELDPEIPEAYNHLGVVLKHKNFLDEAEECYRQAIEKEPDYFDAFHNLGNCLKWTNRFDEAEVSYLRALALRPDSEKTRFSLATLYLLRGQYNKGWKLYDSRFNWQEKFCMDIPIWQGEALAGRKVLLFYEQGLGDMIQFIRYAKQVAQAATKTTIWIQKPLERLLINMQNDLSVCSSGRNIDPEQFDFACSLFSLPAKFNSEQETFASCIPYIHGDQDVSAKWRKIIDELAGGRCKVGIVWAGNPEHADDQNRSIPFELVSKLFDNSTVFWVSLQVGKEVQDLTPRSQCLFDCSGELVDFAETAGVIDNLDLVISVDTAVAHLAGAMGKKIWLLLPYRSDWRWGLHGEDSPWYPTMQLFRQHKLGDWQGVLERVKNLLRDIV